MYPRALISGILVLLSASVAWAQQSETTAIDPSVIEATGNAFESIPPDAVTIRFLVMSLRQSPDSAAEEVNTNTAVLVTALESLGVADLEISRIGYKVGPQREYDREGNQVFEGYSAQITVRAHTAELTETGRIAQTGVMSGARAISGIQFTSSRSGEARQSALRAAVLAARADATTLADAAGGTLGRLLLLTTQAQPMHSLVRSFGSGSGSVDLTPEELTISAQVFSRWQFVAGN